MPSLQHVAEPVLEFPWLLGPPRQCRRESLRNVLDGRLLEVLPGLAGQTGVAQPLEVLVGHARHVGRPQELAQQRAAAPLRGADEVGDTFETEVRSHRHILSFRAKQSGLLRSRQMRPNVLYLHSHDTGRYVQPYGYPVPTPNIQHLTDQGVLFRQAFCAAPVCSGSRAALLTGQCTHATGMLGLAHRGYRLLHPERHIVNVLREAGYWTGLVGEQHVSENPGDLGYDHVADLGSTRVSEVAPAATKLIGERADESEPFFLSVGFFETHREFFEPSSIRDVLYSRPPENVPDNAQTRRDMASFRASARALDQGVGTVLNALEEHGLADDTLVILTTDHGLAFPDAKCTMYDRGIGVMLVTARAGRIRTRPGGRRAGEPARSVPDDL